MKTLMATMAILLVGIANLLLDVADLLTWCAERINDRVWILVGKCKEAP